MRRYLPRPIWRFVRNTLALVLIPVSVLAAMFFHYSGDE